jgi:hypothetical protein
LKPKGPELSEALRMNRKLGLELSLWASIQSASRWAKYNSAVPVRGKRSQTGARASAQALRKQRPQKKNLGALFAPRPPIWE